MCRIAAVMLLVMSWMFALGQPPSPPNVVIIYCDDLGYGDLGCFGNEVIQTPNLDRMADEGLKLTQLYSISPVCTPSRAGLLTGRYPARMGIFSVFFPYSWTGMDPAEITLAEALKTAGYATSHIGKWHLGHREKFLPLQQGFDEYFGIPFSNDMSSVVYLDGNEVVEWEVDQHLTTQLYTEKALDFIERHQEGPFFLYLAYSMPHVPLYASPAFEDTSAAGLYGDVIQELDWGTGRVLDKLDSLGIGENTLVVFTSDNGPWLVFGPDGGSAGPFREGKQFTFEGGMRVPGIVRWPAKVPAGQVTDEMVLMTDWFPTVLRQAGVPMPTDRQYDGQDISPVLLRGESIGDRDLIYFNSHKIEAFRSGDWKIKFPYKGNEWRPYKTAISAHDTLLFNLRVDPGEQQDLYRQRPDIVAGLLAELSRITTSMDTLAEVLTIGPPKDDSHYERQQAWLDSLQQSGVDVNREIKLEGVVEVRE